VKKESFKAVVLWIALIVVFFFVYEALKSRNVSQEITFTQFVQEVLPKEGESQISEITVKGEEIEGVYRNGNTFKTVGDIKEYQKDFVSAGVKIKYESRDSDAFWYSILGTWLPTLFFIFIFIMFLRQLQMGGGKAMSFGKSRHKLLNQSQNKITFKDVAGIDEVKEELQEIIEFLKDPKKFTKLGGRIPKGVLLMGPPGTGKTLLARGVAGEAGVPFFSLSGSDFVEMFVGVGAARVRDLFEQGKKHAPCIIFIDELDAVGRHRGAGLGGGHDEREQTLNQLLVEMDGFESNEGVILVSATNRPDILDPALLRPGRFDRRIVVSRPDVKGREEILIVHTRKKPLSRDVDLKVIARGTPGFSGADLENMVNEAALLAARKNKTSIEMDDLELAKDKVMMGKERRSIIISEKEKKITAYHEAGHTLVAKKIPGTDPIHKVTIIPRGMSLGQTQQLPTEDRYNMSKTFALNQITTLMGGRVAEEVEFSEQTTGAGMDIDVATNLARKMVCEWGMSNLGAIAFGRKDEMIFLGKELSKHQDYSDQTAIKLDREIKRIINECYEKASDIINQNRDILKSLAEALLEVESLSGDQIDWIISGRDIHDFRDDNEDKSPVPPKEKTKPAVEKEKKIETDQFPQIAPEKA
jgi:cell division protease FtsH